MENRYDDSSYRCNYENENGECTHEYEGYGCIKDRCSVYGTTMVKLAGDKKLCSYQKEDYCSRFKKFHCPGAENCHAMSL